ncbi:MAG: MaoC family dehydratase [Alphaproteobacteria bacterium]|nr:MaoC family dehydratase [Alphaproteobacteria bacterium]MDE2514135.1 MaoC family dehydratase [Alphaproteobacteria bacterium]
MRHFASLDALAAAAGETLGTSDWVTVTQGAIDKFAEATGDYQWIHVDRERAKASPFGTTVAHGYLTLALAPRLMDQIYKVDGIRLRINYGLNKVRFTEPVKSGARVRMTLKLLSVEPTTKGARVTTEARFAIDGNERPACVAELVAVLVPN